MICFDKKGKKKPKKPCYKLLALALLVFFVGEARAQTVAQDLIGLGMKPEVADYLAGILPSGSVLGNNTFLKGRNAANSADINILKVNATDDLEISSDSGDYIQFNPGSDAQRLFIMSASSDTALEFKYGDGGVTASQGLSISAQTADADDDASISIASGGSESATRGGYIQVIGNERASVGGEVDLWGGAVATGNILFRIGHSSAIVGVVNTSANTTWAWTNGGAMQNDPTSGGNLNFRAPGTTLAIQESSAGAACSGTLTANGATPVVTSTTCAATGDRIFLQRTSAETGTVNAWVSAISNGVSFSITSEAADTGTYNWLIIHESPA